ncbi:UDP-Glycosyltransferase/glycogen phosphorylase [Aspergillus unguis]
MMAKPIIVISCPPIAGHTNPLLPHARHLINQGHEIHFIAGSESKKAIEETGATFYPVADVVTAQNTEEILAIPEGPERFFHAIKVHFIGAAPIAMEALKGTLEKVREQNPTRKIVILQEYGAMGVWPFLLGAPLPKGYDRFPRVVTFSTVPLPISSMDTAPFGPGMAPDSSEEGRVRNAGMYEAGKWFSDGLTEYANYLYETLGAKEKVTIGIMDYYATGADATVQPCSASLEYSRSDLSPKIHYIGALPRREVDPSLTLPEWWGELLAAKQEGKKVVFVTQGTYAVDYSMLLVPTIKALAEKDDCLVIAVLGVKGATLEDVPVPANTKVLDYFSYEAILPHADVVVTNGGYGGFMQSVMNGVPMVLAGAGQDKSEVCMRGQQAGVAVNLNAASPSLEAIQDGVSTILADGRYKARCEEIRRENEALDCRARLEQLINGACA